MGTLKRNSSQYTFKELFYCSFCLISTLFFLVQSTKVWLGVRILHYAFHVQLCDVSSITILQQSM